MSAGDRGAAWPHGGASHQLGSGAARLIFFLFWLLLGPGLAQAQPAGCSLLDAQQAPQGAAPLCVVTPEGALVARFTVELADTEEERAQGLMWRSQLAPGKGMLFVYPSPRPVAFWMHNTLIPLDMIFVDAAGQILNIHANARPLDDTPIPSRAPTQYVLEIGGGQAARLGLMPGMVLQPLP